MEVVQDSIWQIEPELQQPLPRAVKPRPGIVMVSIFSALGMIGLSGFGTAALGWEAWLSHCDEIAAHQGVTTTARVISIWRRRGGIFGTTTYSIEYRFIDQLMEPHVAAREISAEEVDRIRVGDGLTVRMVPAWFECHALVEFPRADASAWNYAIALAFIGLGPSLLWWFRRQHRQHKALVEHGQAVEGTITRKTIIGAWGPYTFYKAIFNASGTDYTTVGTERYYFGHVGDFVTILYDPLKPRNAIMYASSMYEAIPPQSSSLSPPS